MVDKHIGIMGAHGTGKTTWAKELMEKERERGSHHLCTMVSDVARKCPYPVNKNTSVGAQAWIFHAQVVSELHKRLVANVVICDRTVFDSLAYAEVAGFHDLVDACMPEALRHLGYYDRLYFCRPNNGWLVADGFRDTDPTYQASIDETLADWVGAFDMKVTERRGRKCNGDSV